MEKDLKIDSFINKQTQDYEISEMQIKVLARRLLPEIKKFFADEKVRQEFEEWQANQQKTE